MEKSPDQSRTWNTSSAAQTAAVAAEILRRIDRNSILLLHGDLGAGKTTMVRALAGVLRVKANVNSPTFNLMNKYDAFWHNGEPLQLYHLDLYRLKPGEGLADLDFLELSGGRHFLACIEWPEKAGVDWSHIGEKVYRLDMKADFDGAADPAEAPRQIRLETVRRT